MCVARRGKKKKYADKKIFQHSSISKTLLKHIRVQSHTTNLGIFHVLTTVCAGIWDIMGVLLEKTIWVQIILKYSSKHSVV